MFYIHGELKMQLDKNIILVTLIGPFNDLGVTTWTENVRTQIETFGDNPFFILMNNTNYAGFTHHGSEISNQFNYWLTNQTMIAKAIVQPSLFARKMNLKHIPALKDQYIEYFDNKNDALSWLKTFPEYLNYPE